MSLYDLTPEPFDGRTLDLPATRPSRYRHIGHGPGCSSNPEIGCRCEASEVEGDDVPEAPR